MTDKTCIAFIFARGGSKGIARKNLKPLKGIPLIVHSINTALESPSISRVIVSTDDGEIADTAVNAGAEVPFIRPEELARDDSPEWAAWQHAVNYLLETQCPFDIFVSLPATAPLRSVKDVEDCIALLGDDTDMVLTVREPKCNPYFNMVKRGPGGLLELFSKPDTTVTRRQDVPEVYEITTVAYVTRPQYILEKDGIFDGRVKAVVIPQERAIDIDNEIDFLLANTIINKTE